MNKKQTESKTKIEVCKEHLFTLTDTINPKKEPLTSAILKTFDGCENYSDEAAVEVVKTLHQVALVLYDCINTKEQLLIDNQ